MKTHSAGCIEYFSRNAEERKAFADKWPKYCVECGGAGGGYDPGSFNPYDGGTPPDSWQCPHCLEQGICPRCGSEISDAILDQGEAAGPLPCCGWNWNTDPGDAAPAILHEHDCICPMPEEEF